jgi:hypothetical protein
LYHTAYDSPPYEDHEEYEEEDNKLDLVKDGLWALKAKIKEIKAFNKAFAASLLETKLKLKDMKKHHHHKPSYDYHVSDYTYIPLSLYHRRGSRDISDIPPRYPRFTKISYEEHCRRDRW